MSNKMKVLRSTVPAKRPAGREFGELWVNHADKVMGYIDSSGNPVVPFALPSDIVIRKFDATKAYAAGDLVLGTDGRLYMAAAALAAGAWNAANWVPTEHGVTVAATPPANPVIGQVWYDSGTRGRAFVWDRRWVDLNPTQMPDLSAYATTAAMTGADALAVKKA